MSDHSSSALRLSEVNDIFAFNRFDAGSGSTAVHVLDGATGYRTNLLSTGTWLHPTDASWGFAAG